ncbi:MAG: Xaa-Pro peptidase family protein [Vicinamibacterales bacterium]|nr:peptidase M24 family protein [Acidobacteriota bacterium]MDP7294195.1 Xaa-Pro peptidase family protein [Vicinamibacterales bacterium]MDP7471341.1 Xaa-Pro peptidase family protein [Vicinamibacterales bacterium]MDP7671937.1 Xaa-Pro peptidase family protein [Vicinamibacterales bacterium]HJO39303.1 Xaa-Pro peptidase family protein [Vicinamibacterales bacterium]
MAAQGGACHLGRRLGAVRDRFVAEGLDGLLITHVPNVRYLTNFTGSAAALLVGTSSCRLVTDGRYLTAIRTLLASPNGPPDTDIVPVERAYETTVSDLLAGIGWRRIGFEAAHTSVKTHRQWTDGLRRASPSAGRFPELVPTERTVEQVRAVKDPGELATLRRGGQMLSTVAAEVQRTLAPGQSELEVAATVDHTLRSGGFQRSAFDTIVASGPNSALPHAQPGTRRLAVNDIVLLDFGGVHDGYCVDVSRVASIGPPGEDAKRLHAAVAEAQTAAIEAVRPGAWASDVDGAARRVLEERGLGEAFSHGTGHGLGLEIHEEPRVGRRDADRDRAVAAGADGPLAPGMVFTIEPGAYEPGVGGVRLEDDVVVTDDGCEMLTDVGRDLWVVS